MNVYTIRNNPQCGFSELLGILSILAWLVAGEGLVVGRPHQWHMAVCISMYILIPYILQQTNVETYTWKTRAVFFFAQRIHWKVSIPYYQWFFSPPVAPELGTGRPDGSDGGHPPQQLRLSSLRGHVWRFHGVLMA